MSLINDALKRAQQEMSDKPAAAFQQQENPSLYESAPPIATSRTPAIISIIVATAILGFIAFGMAKLRNSSEVPSQASALTAPNPPPAPAALPTSPSPPPAAATPSCAQERPNNAAQAVKEVSKAIAAVTCPPPAGAPVIAKKPRPALKLSGIMAGPTGEAALINGRMVRVGESIEGVTLESIENQTANLSFEGETFSLGL